MNTILNLFTKENLTLFIENFPENKSFYMHNCAECVGGLFLKHLNSPYTISSDGDSVYLENDRKDEEKLPLWWKHYFYVLTMEKSPYISSQKALELLKTIS